MAQTTGTTTITRKPQDGKSPVAYEIVPERTVYTSDETNELPFKVYKIVGEERTLLHEEIEGGTYVLESVLAGDVLYDEATDMYVLSDSGTFGYGDNCTVVLHLSSDDVVLATFTWGFTQSGKQGTTFSIRKWEDVKVGDKFRVESAEDGVLISDIVIYTDANGVTSKWICKKAFTVKSSGTTTKDNTTPKLGSEYWKAFDHYYNVATDLVLADKAIIDNLLLNNMSAYPKKEDGSWDTENPTVHVDGNTGEISLVGNIRANNYYGNIGEVTIGSDGRKYLSDGSYFRVLNQDDYYLDKPDGNKNITIFSSNNYIKTIHCGYYPFFIPVAVDFSGYNAFKAIKMSGESCLTLAYIDEHWRIINFFGSLKAVDNQNYEYNIRYDGVIY